MSLMDGNGTAAPSSKTRFGTILVSRSNQCPPTALEVLLRDHCRTIKIVDKALNGAHMIVPPASSGEATLAVRAYHAKDIPPHMHDSLIWTDSPSPLQEHIDCLVSFQQAFALTIVLFIVPEENDHVENMGSLFNQATIRLSRTTEANASSSNTTRVIMVPSPEAAVQSLIHFADALTQAKRQLKRAFFERQQRYSHFPQTSSVDVGGEAAVLSVRNAVREWTRDNSCHEQDSDIILNVMGSLRAVVEHSATGLSTLPVEQRTKDLLRDFFYRNAAYNEEQNLVSPPADPRTQALRRSSHISQNAQSNPDTISDPCHLPHHSIRSELADQISTFPPDGIHPSPPREVQENNSAWLHD